MPLCALVFAAVALATGSDAESGESENGESCGCASSRSSADTVEIRELAAVSLDASAVPSAQKLAFADDARSRVPAGTSVLGTNAPHFVQDGEGPAYSVTFARDFWADTYEVTNRRWAEFIAATGFVTDAEKFGWSFVHELAVPKTTLDKITKAVKDLEWWLPV